MTNTSKHKELSRWKLYREARGKKSVGNYLIVIDDDKHQ